MKSIIVSTYWLDSLWSVIFTSDEADETYFNFKGYQPCEEHWLRLCNKAIIPNFRHFSERGKFRIKESFRYALNTFSNDDLVHTIERSSQAAERYIPPLYEDHEVKKFAQLIWRCLFFEEEYKIICLEMYDLRNDVEYSDPDAN